MKKAVNTLLAALVFVALFNCYAFADVAGGSIIAIAIGLPLLAVAVAIIAVVIIERAVRKKKADKSSDSEDPWDLK
ncbi:MAG: hypothetical protein EOM54_02930 [Clostridia bacterium]|nr:hypothetical protein [Clostridia bacterium]